MSEDSSTDKQNRLNAKIDSHWILLRGLARESRHWGDFPKALETSLNESERDPSGRKLGLARVDTIDLPGNGRYSEMKSPISVGEIAEFARAKHLEIRERQRKNGEAPARASYLVAISLGAMVASRWLERWPDDFKGCVLINSSFRGYSPMFKRLSPPAVWRLMKIISADDLRVREREVFKMVSQRPELEPATVEAWTQLALERPITYENFARQLLAAARFRTRLDRPPVPALILNSLNDKMVSPTCSETIASKWQSQLERHPTAGHDLPLDDPRWVIEKIRDFARETSETAL